MVFSFFRSLMQTHGHLERDDEVCSRSFIPLNGMIFAFFPLGFIYVIAVVWKNLPKVGIVIIDN